MDQQLSLQRKKKIPRAIFLKEITEPFKQMNMEINYLCENVLY